MPADRPTLPILPLFVLLAGACAGEPAPERGLPAGGKADSLSPEECAALDPATDEHGFCRAADGRFAPAQCCAESEVCQSAFLDDQGTCRRQDDGTFAPASCCAALCDGATLDAQGFCRADSGQFAPSACCADQCYEAQAPEGSCAPDACGGAAPGGQCFCDDQCADFGDCCADKAPVCGGDGNPPETVIEGTCDQNTCGGPSENGPCFCDDQCSDFGDCCVNKAAICGGPGLFVEATVVDCGPDECEGAAVDDDGACRKPNGEFAKVSCCAALPACASATVDEDGFCRRQDNGQFAPALCCAELCDGASLDDDGVCRDADGQFALKGCCADECLVLQDGGGRHDGVSGVTDCE